MVISVHTVFTPSQTHSTAVSVPTRSVRWAISLVYGATSGFKVCWLFGVYTHVCTLAEYSNSNELCPFPMWQTSSMCKQEMGTITYRRPAPQMGTITYRRQLHSGVHVWWPKTDNKHAILGYTSTNPSSATSVPVLHRHRGQYQEYWHGLIIVNNTEVSHSMQSCGFSFSQVDPASYS